jgi:glycosyltransferase involved in cell wall biosynthesis
MKIAIVTETFLPSTDGIVTRLTATIRYLRQQGHDVLVIAPEPVVDEFEGVRLAGIRSCRFFLYKDRKLAMPRREVGRLLDQFDPDIVHVVNPAVLGVAGIYYGRKYPLIASYHTRIPQYADYYRLPFLKPILWWYLRLLHNRADLNLCTSRAILDELSGKRFRNVRLWQRGVDADQFGPQHRSGAMRSRLTNGEPDKRIILYVGRLAAEKNIEKIRDVMERSGEFRLAIVGDGPHRKELEAHFRGTATVFTGFLHGEELAQAYASSDLFVFPSTTETLGLVLLEAMASGIPVVAADSGPTREQVANGVTGLLYDPADRESFTRSVLSLLRDDELRARMGAQAREAARDLGWEGPSRQLLDLYRHVVKARKSRTLPVGTYEG